MNVPAHMLDDAAFISTLAVRIAAARHLADHLGIEITESEAMNNIEKTIVALHGIRRRRGCEWRSTISEPATLRSRI